MGGAILPPQSIAEILSLGDAAVEPLVTVLVDSQLRDPQGPAAGWASVHAARLLGQLPGERVVEPLLEVLASSAPLSPLRAAVEQALGRLGALLVNPILARLPAMDSTYLLQLLSLLANAGVRDDRILVQLVSALSESPPEAAMYLAEYGDPAALPALSRALDAHTLSLPDDPSDDHAVFELREPIHLLGGKLTAAQQPLQARPRDAMLPPTRRRSTGPSTLALQSEAASCAWLTFTSVGVNGSTARQHATTDRLR